MTFGLVKTGYLCTTRNGCSTPKEKEELFQGVKTVARSYKRNAYFCRQKREFADREKENLYNGDITVTKSEKNSAYFCRRKRRDNNNNKIIGVR